VFVLITKIATNQTSVTIIR